ncbi:MULTISPECIES: ATP-binding cassette domain-containing protein [unclassified Sphingopyxis]|uniref:phosphonate ABC transporter ATP-binding protein n=1 Tax=unclassified Sphingopyxis TaxID=2614943 RepID=UPI0028604238|nr:MULTISPECIES: ATP-binding cassette domain-containing protein [unclassified Sphingopyxis]MDR7062046.1 phosphonate transport system ATP-binding protein [Sphingopyxis sp. BE235]MDR7182504.1 phosphonate transport system ATP-binding protein [Sphingopyxis sp. BE249]
MIDIGIADLCVRHAGGADALADATLFIPAGQFCAVLGASGAGKSTLLRAIAGLVAPSDGRILYDGAPASRAQRRRIGLIPQDFALSGRASVARNVMAVADIDIARSLAGLYPPADRMRAAHLLAGLGLDEAQLTRRADSLSGGQQQRVAVARALLHRPAIILADEPIASLDPATGEATLALLRNEARSLGATLLCSLHQPELARRFADRIIMLDAGRVVFDGPPAMLDGERTLPRIRAVAR